MTALNIILLTASFNACAIPSPTLAVVPTVVVVLGVVGGVDACSICNTSSSFVAMGYGELEAGIVSAYTAVVSLLQQGVSSILMLLSKGTAGTGLMVRMIGGPVVAMTGGPVVGMSGGPIGRVARVDGTEGTEARVAGTEGEAARVAPD